MFVNRNFPGRRFTSTRELAVLVAASRIMREALALRKKATSGFKVCPIVKKENRVKQE